MNIAAGLAAIIPPVRTRCSQIPNVLPMEEMGYKYPVLILNVLRGLFEAYMILPQSELVKSIFWSLFPQTAFFVLSCSGGTATQRHLLDVSNSGC